MDADFKFTLTQGISILNILEESYYYDNGAPNPEVMKMLGQALDALTFLCYGYDRGEYSKKKRWDWNLAYEKLWTNKY